MARDPTVSVIMPSYNHEKYVGEAIESVLSQTYGDFEFIITDDGSQDKTVGEIRRFKDSRIKFFAFKKNRGACAAGNNCIKKAHGKYIALINSDDVWELNKLEKQVNFLDKNQQFCAVFSRASFIDEESREFTGKDNQLYNIFAKNNYTKEKWLNRFFYKGNSICHPSMLIRKTVYSDVGLYDERLACLPDFDMWVRICLHCGFFILNDSLIKFRVRAKSANASGDRPTVHVRNRFEYKQILNHFLQIDDVEFFRKIFPESRKYGAVKNRAIPFFLARLALDSKDDFKQLWGQEILFDFLKKCANADFVRKEYNFTFSDFIELTGKYDVFKIFHTAVSYPEITDSEARQLKNEIDRLKNSISWRMTSPLRSLVRKLPALAKLYK